jgi:beta-phosphoglucomutase-like phosphatase (HAD superfamily)
MRSRFELVIFDCDGVLVDSEPIINQAHAQVLTVCGYPITEQDLVERFCGMSDAECSVSSNASGVGRCPPLMPSVSD